MSADEIGLKQNRTCKVRVIEYFFAKNTTITKRRLCGSKKISPVISLVDTLQSNEISGLHSRMMRQIGYWDLRTSIAVGSRRCCGSFLSNGARNVHWKSWVTEWFCWACDTDLTVRWKTVHLIIVVVKATAWAQFEWSLAGFGVEDLIGHSTVGAHVARRKRVFRVGKYEALWKKRKVSRQETPISRGDYELQWSWQCP